VAAAQVDRRKMPGALPVHLGLRDLEAGARERHAEARVDRGLLPLLDARGRGRRELQRVLEGREAGERLADELLQRALLDLEVVRIGYRLGSRLVVARLGLERVDDGGGADLEVALRL